MHHPAPVVWNLTKKIPLNYTDYHCSISYKTGWLRELRRKSTKLYHFGGPWVRIQAQTENVSVIFFCKDFSTFSYLKLASDIFGGVHKQCGLSKGRERGCCTTYVIIQFDVQSCFFYHGSRFSSKLKELLFDIKTKLLRGVLEGRNKCGYLRTSIHTYLLILVHTVQIR